MRQSFATRTVCDFCGKTAALMPPDDTWVSSSLVAPGWILVPHGLSRADGSMIFDVCDDCAVISFAQLMAKLQG